MLLSLTDEVSARVTEMGLTQRIRYSPGGRLVAVNGYGNREQREMFARDTFGSASWLWSASDELRFAKENGDLAGALFAMPEEDPEIPGVYAPWVDAPVIVGGLNIREPQNFDLPPAQSRWVSPKAGHVVALYAEGLDAGGEKLRLRFCTGIDLLFCDRKLVGWLLESPERHLVQDWEFPSDTDLDDVGAQLLFEYFELVGAPNVDRMMDGDEQVHRQLLDFADRVAVSAAREEKKAALEKAVRGYIDNFYE